MYASRAEQIKREEVEALIPKSRPGRPPTILDEVPRSKFAWLQQINPHIFLVAFLCIALVFTRSLEVILYIRIAKKMKNYSWFLASIVLTLSFVVICWPVVWYKIQTKAITPEMLKFPKLKLLTIGALDAVTNLLSTIAIPYLSGATNVVVPQAVVPLTLLFSCLFADRYRFRWTHFVGAAVIAVGCTIQCMPVIIEPIQEAIGHWFWMILLLISTIPNAASNVYKEYGLKDYASLDLWYFNAWVATAQLAVGLLLAPTIFIPLLAGGDLEQPVHPVEFPQYLADAALCFIGVNTYDDDLCDGSSPTWSIFLIFTAMTVGFNIMLSTFTSGPALQLTVSLLRLLVSDFGFGVQVVAGEATYSLQEADIICLLLLLAGLILYRTDDSLGMQGPNQPIGNQPSSSISEVEITSGGGVGGTGNRRTTSSSPALYHTTSVSETGPSSSTNTCSIARSPSFLALTSLGVQEFEPFGARETPVPIQRDPPRSSIIPRIQAHDIRRDYLRKLGVSNASPSPPMHSIFSSVHAYRTTPIHHNLMDNDLIPPAGFND
mmetsp:Transcript_40508/g.65699  ORF Transcript_40508/g.65699 Transcript_40508/m.65699 type:complete len:548 (-) Transcript_40508:233-1876(-)